MPREVNPPRAFASPLPVAGKGKGPAAARRSTSSSANGSSSRLAVSSTTATADEVSSLPASGIPVPAKRAKRLKKSVRKSAGPTQKQAVRPRQSSSLAASTFNLPQSDDDDDDTLDSLLSTRPLLAPPRYAARISLVDRLSFPSSVAAASEGRTSTSPGQAYPSLLTPPNSQESFEAAPVVVASLRKKARDSGFVGSDEAGEEYAYAAMVGARERSRPKQSPPPASAPARRAFSHAPQSPLKSSLVRARKRTPSMLNSPNKGPGAEANASPNPKARKQARASAAAPPSKSLNDNCFAFSTPGAGPSSRPITGARTGPRTERPAKKSALSQSTKSAAAQRRRSAPTSLPKGVPIVRTATDPNMPSPPPSPSDDPILLRGAERIRFLAPSPGADAAREVQARQDAEQDDELGLSASSPVPQEAISQPPRLASLDQSSDREIDRADDDYWADGGMDGGGFDVGNFGPSSGSDHNDDEDGDDDPDNTFYLHSKSSGARQGLRLSDLDSLLALRAAPAPVALVSPSSRGTTPQEAPPRAPTPPLAVSRQQPLVSPSTRPRSVSATPTPPSSSPAPRLRSPSAAEQQSSFSREASHSRLEVSPRASAEGSSQLTFGLSPPSIHTLRIASTPRQLEVRAPVALTPVVPLASAGSPSTTPTVAPASAPLSASPARSPIAPVRVVDMPPLAEVQAATPEPAVIRVFEAPVEDSPPRSTLAQPIVSETPMSQRTATTSSATTPSQSLEPAYTPAPALSPYVFGPPRTPESYSGSEPDEESQARHSLVPADDGDNTLTAQAPGSEDSVLDEFDRQWETRDRSLDASGWAAQVRSSLSPDSTDDEDEPEQDESTLAEPKSVVAVSVEVEVEVKESDFEPVELESVTLGTLNDDCVVTEDVGPETFGDDSPEASPTELGVLDCEPEPEALESRLESSQVETTPEPSDKDEHEPLAPQQDTVDLRPEEDTAQAPPFEHDTEEEELNGGGSTAGDSDWTHAATDHEGTGNGSDDDGDSFFGEIEQKSLLEKMADDDDEPPDASDVLDVTAGAFDHQTDQLAEFRAFVNAIDEPDEQDNGGATVVESLDDEIDGSIAAIEPAVTVEPQSPPSTDLEFEEEVSVTSTPLEVEPATNEPPAAEDLPLTEADRKFDKEVQLYTETGHFASEEPMSTVEANKEDIINESSTDVEPPVDVVTAELSSGSAAPITESPSRSASPIETLPADMSVELNDVEHTFSAEDEVEIPPASPTIRQRMPSPSPIRVRSPSLEAPIAARTIPSAAPATTSRSPAGNASFSMTDDAGPWVKVSSNDPRQAARATAFLKLFHDYIEADADPDVSSASSARDRSTASRLSSLNVSHGRSAFFGDMSMCSVADDLLMEAEQEIALEAAEAAPAADADMSSDEDDNPKLVIPGSFTRAGPTLFMERPRPAVTVRQVVVDRPWRPAEWRALMESLDAAGPSASFDAAIERFMLRSGVDEHDLEGDWSRPKLALRLASIQQRRSNEAVRASKRRRSHNPHSALLEPYKAASATLSRSPGRRRSPAAAFSQSIKVLPTSAGSASKRPTTTAARSLTDRVLSFLNVWKRDSLPTSAGALRTRASIPELDMAPPALARPGTPEVIPPSSSASPRRSYARPAGSSSVSRRHVARPAPAAGRLSSSGRSVLHASAFAGGPSRSASIAVASRPIAIPRPLPLPSSSSSAAANFSTSFSSAHSSSSAHAALSRSHSCSQERAQPTVLRPRSSFDRSPPDVGALVRSFERAGGLPPLSQQQQQQARGGR